MRQTLKLTHVFLTLLALALFAVQSQAQDPGTAYPRSSQVSDQRAGSVLVFNIYSSSPSSPNLENARLSITNTNAATNASVTVHLFMIDGATCSVADSFVCLTQAQTTSFLTSDMDPGVTGYAIAVAVSGVTGCPVAFNYLMGDEYVKFASGHSANLAAVAFAAVYDQFAACQPDSVTATLYFDNAGPVNDSYNLLPRTLALDSLTSLADGNSTMLVINRIGGNLGRTAAAIGPVFGLLFDDKENAASFGFTAASCQFRSLISSSFPRTTPRFNSLVPTGHTGWAKLWADGTDVGLLGATINFNPNAVGVAGAFNSGHNLHSLTINNFGFATTNAPSITIPIVPPGC